MDVECVCLERLRAVVRSCFIFLCFRQVAYQPGSPKHFMSTSFFCLRFNLLAKRPLWFQEKFHAFFKLYKLLFRIKKKNVGKFAWRYYYIEAIVCSATVAMWIVIMQYFTKHH
ncbi:hypothetical protein BD560DRAFT_487773 [Blakeslea trispora]|nr:hypothetical protein BD560DRAFT_487773 [Blakeslea trispora]